jgi:hypothetical protein
MKLIFSFRTWRWLACAALVPVLWACNARRLVAPSSGPHAVEQKEFVQALNRKLDVIFMIDNSQSMKDFQTVLARNLQSFMTPLENLPGGLPDLHLGIISSSVGASRFGGEIMGCGWNELENDDGAFQTAPRNPTGCARGALRSAEEKFIKANLAGNNFADSQSTVAEVFGCMAFLDAMGCGFEHQLFAIQRALERGETADDLRNGGFLRRDAYLAIVLLTNEDDCSAPSSELFDASQNKNSDHWGGLQTGYRCVEFGYLCNGQRPPRGITGPTPLGTCTSAERQGELLSVKEMAEFVKSFKRDGQGDDSKRIFVAALLGPTDRVVAELQTGIRTRDNTVESQPRIAHSCDRPPPAGLGTENLFADPGIRLTEFVREFGPDNGLIRNICDVENFPTSMDQIATVLSRLIGPQCIEGEVSLKNDGTPDCLAVERKKTADGTGETTDKLPFCVAGGPFPCWQFGDPTRCTGPRGGRPFEICRDQGCNQATRAPDSIDARVSCAVELD